MNENLNKKFESLKKEFISFKNNQANKKLRIRDIAHKLGVSEAELLSTQIDNQNIKYLKILNYKSFFKNLFQSKKVMLLIRSDFIVHEKVVNCDELKYEKDLISFKNKENNDLTFFNTKDIINVFFENKLHQNKPLLSFQFFDGNGDAILKIFLKSKDYGIFNEIAKKHIEDYDFNLQKNKQNKAIQNNVTFEKKYNKNKCKIVKTDHLILRYILENISKLKIPIQLHAFGNSSKQYHFGLAKNIMDFGPWINVIDKKFNIHAMESKLTNSHIIIDENKVSKTYHIEFLDNKNNLILYIGSIKNYENKFNILIEDKISK